MDIDASVREGLNTRSAIDQGTRYWLAVSSKGSTTKRERVDFWEVPRLSQVFRRCFRVSATLFACRLRATRWRDIQQDKISKQDKMDEA
jgi:hypothetical protein